MIPVNRYEFLKNQVVYLSVYKGDAYCSFHNRSNMTDEQAKKAFHREHTAEVLSLYVMKKQNDNHLINQ